MLKSWLVNRADSNCIFYRLTRPIRRVYFCLTKMNLKALINRATLSAKNGARKLRTLQIQLLGGDIRESVEHFEPYGFTSEPHVGAEAIGLALGGDRDQTLAVVVTDRRYRPTDLKDGEVCVFDDLGRKIYLSRDGIRVEGVSSPVLVNTSASVTVDAPLTKCTGNLEVGGNIVATVIRITAEQLRTKRCNAEQKIKPV